MEHKLLGLCAADGATSHDWVARCTCGWESEVPRRVPECAWLDFCGHDVRERRETARVASSAA